MVGPWAGLFIVLFHRVNWDDDDELCTQVITGPADNTLQ